MQHRRFKRVPEKQVEPDPEADYELELEVLRLGSYQYQTPLPARGARKPRLDELDNDYGSR